MIWSKKHIVRKITYGSRYENGQYVTYTNVEKQYILASNLRELTDGVTVLKQHDYILRGKQARKVKMFILKFDI